MKQELNSITRTTAQQRPLREAMAILTYSLSEGSQRQYAHTFNRWLAFCQQTDHAPDTLNAAHVIDFLESEPLARRTRQARLTHLRRLAQALHTSAIENPAYRQHYEQLKLLSLPKDSTLTRERKALQPDEVFSALMYWPTDTPLGLRNRALLGVLFYAGLRRSEAVMLRWADVDFHAGLVTVRRGKGGRERTIPFASRKALGLLDQWRACVPDCGWVFVPVVKGGKRVGRDTPISAETVRRVCLASGDFRPHDARRTLLTNLLTSGTSLPDAQFIAGHARGETTMQYAVVRDAEEVKGRVKLNY